jgi:glucose-1-phosphate thymidylyltransferase
MTNSYISHALVLCGGQGREMGPLSRGLPKPLISLLGVDVITRILRGLKLSGIQSVTVVVQGSDQLRRRALEVGGDIDLEVDVVDQGSYREVWGAVIAAKRSVLAHVSDGSFLLSYGDIVSTPDFYAKLLEDSSAAGYPVASVVLQKDVTTYGVVKVGQNNCIEKIVEKPVSLDPDIGGYVLAGGFILPTSIFDMGDDGQGFVGVLNNFAHTYTLGLSIWSGVWVDLGYPWDVLTASSRLLGEIRQSSISAGAKISPTAIIEPPVIIEDGAIIDHHSVVRGPAYIGRNVYVGTGALIHGFTSLEENVSVGAYAEISGSVLQPGSWVGRGCFIGNSVVGLGVVFEPHVTTLSVLRGSEAPVRLEPTITNGRVIHKIGSIIGNRARIGANTVLYPSTLVESEAVVEPNTVLRGVSK